MGLVRLILLGVLVWLAVRFVRGLVPAVRKAPPAQDRIDGGDLVEDPQCGVYVPKVHAVPGRGGQYFCSEACRDAHEGRRG